MVSRQHTRCLPQWRPRLRATRGGTFRVSNGTRSEPGALAIPALGSACAPAWGFRLPSDPALRHARGGPCHVPPRLLCPFRKQHRPRLPLAHPRSPECHPRLPATRPFPQRQGSDTIPIICRPPVCPAPPACASHADRGRGTGRAVQFNPFYPAGPSLRSSACSARRSPDKSLFDSVQDIVH